MGGAEFRRCLVRLSNGGATERPAVPSTVYRVCTFDYLHPGLPAPMGFCWKRGAGGADALVKLGVGCGCGCGGGEENRCLVHNVCTLPPSAAIAPFQRQKRTLSQFDVFWMISPPTRLNSATPSHATLASLRRRWFEDGAGGRPNRIRRKAQRGGMPVAALFCKTGAPRGATMQLALRAHPRRPRPTCQRASRGSTCPKLKGFDVAPIVGAFLPRSGWKLSWFTGGAQQHQSSEELAGKGRGSVAWAATAVRGWEAVDLGRRVGAKHTIAVRLQPLNQTSKQNVRFANPFYENVGRCKVTESASGGIDIRATEAH